jgi:shikimate dehydrogenase
VILGAGGAARAIAVEAALAGAASITVVNRGRERGEQLVALLNAKTPLGLGEGAPSGIAEGGHSGAEERAAWGAASGAANFAPWDGDYRVPPGTDILVNATSIGLFPDVDARVPLDVESLRPGMVVADVIGNPPRTRLIREAEARGCTALDGLGMLVNQGVIAIRHWIGLEPDPAVMRAALEDALSR